MKFIHLADLHIGKRVNEFSMIEEQEHVLESIVQTACENDVEVVVIAGDVYDRPIPPQEAVELLDKFVTKLNENNIKCVIVSGNHDSSERLAFGSSLLKKSGVYISPVFDARLKTITLKDDYGDVDFVLLPFLRPVQIKRYYDVGENQCALKVLLQNHPKRENIRTIMVAHQFVTAFGKNPEQCDSESISVGSLDSVDVEIFKHYNYVALGHIHGPQKVGYEHIRYAGSPLKFSFSEVNHKKSFVIVNLDKNGNVKTQLIPIKPKHDMRKIKTSIQDIFKQKEIQYDYMHITLTDKSVMNAMQKVRTIYPNTMAIEFENIYTPSNVNVKNIENFDIASFFEKFYEIQNGDKMSEEMKDFLYKNSIYGDEI